MTDLSYGLGAGQSGAETQSNREPIGDAFYEAFDEGEIDWPSIEKAQIDSLLAMETLNARDFRSMLVGEDGFVSFADALKTEIVATLGDEAGDPSDDQCIEILKRLCVEGGVFAGSDEEVTKSQRELERALRNCFSNRRPPSETWAFKLCFALRMGAVRARHFLNNACEINAYVYRDIRHVVYIYSLHYGLTYTEAQEMLQQFYRRAIDQVGVEELRASDIVLAVAPNLSRFYQIAEEAFVGDEESYRQACSAFLKAALDVISSPEDKAYERHVGAVESALRYMEGKGLSLKTALRDSVDDDKAYDSLERALDKRYETVLGNWLTDKTLKNAEEKLREYCTGLAIGSDDMDILAGSFDRLVVRDSKSITNPRNDTTQALANALLAFLSGNIRYASDEERDTAFLNSLLEDSKKYIGFSKKAYEEYLQLLADTIKEYVYLELDWVSAESLSDEERGARAKGSSVVKRLRKLLHATEDPFQKSTGKIELGYSNNLQNLFFTTPSFGRARNFFGNDDSEWYPAKNQDVDGRHIGDLQSAGMWQDVLESIWAALDKHCVTLLANKGIENAALKNYYLCRALSHIVSIPMLARATFAKVEAMYTRSNEVNVRGLKEHGLTEYPALGYFSEALNEPGMMSRTNDGVSKGRSILYMLCFCNFVLNPFNNDIDSYIEDRPGDHDFFDNFYARLKRLSYECGFALPSVNRRFDKALCMAVLQYDSDDDDRHPFSYLEEMIMDGFEQGLFSIPND